MNEKKAKKRTLTFRWESKQELYTYFDETYGLKKQHIDKEIKSVREDFKIRKDQMINIAELWQKVGMNLEKKFGVCA
jgi:hypothetical protein